MKSAIALILLASLSGCVQTSYQNSSGEKFTRTAFLLNTQADVEVQKKPDGTAVVKIAGYKSESSQVVEAAVSAAVKAATK